MCCTQNLERPDMAGFEGRFERLELKYVIDEFTADRVRSRIQAYCRHDPHNDLSRGRAGDDRGRNHPGYEVRSLYLDSPGLALFRAKERGDAERVKLRVRTYGDSSMDPVLEIKRRVSDVVSKTRAKIDRAQVERIARGYLPASSDAEVESFLNDFAINATRLGAQPTLSVRYDREAYSSEVDTYARVTFDRQIAARRTESWNLDDAWDDWCYFDDHRVPSLRPNNVVLELKCESFIPCWITDLIRSEALKRQSFSKYGIGVYLTGLGLGEVSLPRRSAKKLAWA
jgi:SPX domain protein involved in polyphosphate accumulation